MEYFIRNVDNEEPLPPPPFFFGANQYHPNGPDLAAEQIDGGDEHAEHHFQPQDENSAISAENMEAMFVKINQNTERIKQKKKNMDTMIRMNIEHQQNMEV